MTDALILKIAETVEISTKIRGRNFRFKRFFYALRYWDTLWFSLFYGPGQLSGMSAKWRSGVWLQGCISQPIPRIIYKTHFRKHISRRIYGTSLSVYRDKEFVSRVDVARIYVVDLTYVIYRAADIDTAVRIIFFDEAPERIVFGYGHLGICTRWRSFCPAWAKYSKSGKREYHSTYEDEYEEPYRVRYSVMMSSFLFHPDHHPAVQNICSDWIINICSIYVNTFSNKSLICFRK